MLRIASVTFVVVALAGCRTGATHFDSTVSGRAFDPAGTVFAYLDAHDDALVEDKNPRVAVAMTWIIFDPNSDLNDLEGSALADYSHELKLRDALSLVFAAQGDVKAGAKFKSTVAGPDDVPGAESGNGKLLTRVHLAPERLDASSTYGDVVPFASLRTVDVAIRAADFTSSPALDGDITITYKRATTDPGNAREGAFNGTFSAPVAGERTAEENLALLDVEDVLGLPLPARPAAVTP